VSLGRDAPGLPVLSVMTFLRRRVRDFGADALNASVPRRGYTVTRDLVFGPDERNRLDFYMPDSALAPPVVLFNYGGGWTHGSKAIYRFLGEALTSAGIAVAVADYRLYPQVRYPLFVEDTALAFHFLRNNIHAYGGDRERLFAMGHSAGAYNVVMLASDPRYIRDEDRSALKGVIGIAGLYNFLPIKDPTTIEVFGGAERKETQPIAYVDRKLAPMLLAHGGKDTVVHPGNSRSMAKRLKAAGSEVVLCEYPEAGHTDIIISLARGFRGRTSLRKDIVEFVRGHVG